MGQEIRINRMVLKTYTVTCSRCLGRGHLPQYNHVEGGICFKCRGNKVLKGSTI